MIKTKDLVPGIYYNQSRDFQLLGRVFEVVFNYLKTNIDLMSGSPLSKNLDDTLIALATKTVGFNTKHAYNTRDLKSICEVFSSLLKIKGTKTSIENACKTLMYTQNLYGVVNVNTSNEDDKYTILIDVPVDLTDLILLEDLFDYILPAGYDFRFRRVSRADTSSTILDTSLNAPSLIVSIDDLSKITKPEERDSRPVDVLDSKETSKISTTYTSRVYKPE